MARRDLGKLGFGLLPRAPTAGYWFPLQEGTPVNTVTPTNARAYAMPFWPGRACTFTDLAMEVTTAFTTAGNIRAGVYTDDGTGLPGSRTVTDFGTVSGSAAVKTWAPTTFAMTPQLYWIVIAFQGSSGGSPLCRGAAGYNRFVGETAATPTLSSNISAYYTDTGFSGAFPSTFGAIAGSVFGPAMHVKVS